MLEISPSKQLYSAVPQEREGRGLRQRRGDALLGSRRRRRRLRRRRVRGRLLPHLHHLVRRDELHGRRPLQRQGARLPRPGQGGRQVVRCVGRPAGVRHPAGRHEARAQGRARQRLGEAFLGQGPGGERLRDCVEERRRLLQDVHPELHGDELHGRGAR